VVFRLAKNADVVLQNFRPGVVERMGIGYKDLKQANPDLIYVNLSGFGRTGPMADSRVYDPIIQASSGFCEHNADEEGARLTSQVIMDKIASTSVAQTILGALVAKDRGAGGQEIDMTMLDAGINFIWPEVFSAQTWDVPVVPVGPQPHSFYRMWNTADAVGALALSLSTDQDWHNFAAAFGRPELASDSRFKDGQKREANIEAWTIAVQEILNYISLERDQMRNGCWRAGHPCPDRG
jgi:crotonobetainyl-CoA:carnitine CoA-transferase CaiB-like acyl-CoA transferase